MSREFDRFATIIRFHDGSKRSAGGGEDALAGNVGREVRRSDDAGVDDERRQALSVEQVAHELELDALGVERAEEEDGHNSQFFLSRITLTT